MRSFGIMRAAAVGLSASVSLVLTGAARAEPAAAAPAPSLLAAITGGKLLIDLRPRYEEVDQAGFVRDAQAFTLRTQLGWRTAEWRRLTAELGFENVAAVGGQHYNSGVNGRTDYPVIADPPTSELHIADLQWAPLDGVRAVVGRQRINLDDQRFIGTVSWRQDEQTFDAARFDAAVGRFSLTYVYLEHINRVYARVLDWSSDSHAVNAYFAVGKPLKFEGFSYALDLAQSPANSSLTYGGRASGELDLRALKLSYAATYARQKPYRNNPGRFDLAYWRGELAAGWSVFALRADYEVLGGDGMHGFSTPLATLHAFQGWADVFLVTPATGIRDANLSLDLRPPLRLGRLAGADLFIRYHDFRTEMTGQSLGREWDLMATAQVAPHLTALAGLADYRGPIGGPPSRTKVWAGFEFKL